MYVAYYQSPLLGCKLWHFPIFKKEIYFYGVCVCVRTCVHVWRACTFAGQPAKLDLQVVLNHSTWVMGTELRPSARTVFILNP